MPDDINGKYIFRAALRHVLAPITRLLALAERALRPVDRLDYAIRRYLIPVPFKEARSIPPRHVPIGLQSSIQESIGQHLRAQYAVDRSMPARLASLLREFEQRNRQADGFARSRYARTA